MCWQRQWSERVKRTLRSQSAHLSPGFIIDWVGNVSPMSVSKPQFPHLNIGVNNVTESFKEIFIKLNMLSENLNLLPELKKAFPYE